MSTWVIKVDNEYLQRWRESKDGRMHEYDAHGDRCNARVFYNLEEARRIRKRLRTLLNSGPGAWDRNVRVVRVTPKTKRWGIWDKRVSTWFTYLRGDVVEYSTKKDALAALPIWGSDEDCEVRSFIVL